MANRFSLDTTEFQGLLRRLDSIGGDVERVVSKVLLEAAQKVEADTDAAVVRPNMPAGGKYWTGATKEAIVRNAQVTWDGLTASVPIGFDFAEAGAGGYLISGTPKMAPVAQLHKMFKEKSYLNEIRKKMADQVLDSIMNQMTQGG